MELSENLKYFIEIEVIDRDKTAISKYNFSKPVQTDLKYNLLEAFVMSTNSVYFWLVVRKLTARLCIQRLFPPPLLFQ